MMQRLSLRDRSDPDPNRHDGLGRSRNTVQKGHTRRARSRLKPRTRHDSYLNPQDEASVAPPCRSFNRNDPQAPVVRFPPMNGRNLPATVSCRIFRKP